MFRKHVVLYTFLFQWSVLLSRTESTPDLTFQVHACGIMDAPLILIHVSLHMKY